MELSPFCSSLTVELFHTVSPAGHQLEALLTVVASASQQSAPLLITATFFVIVICISLVYMVRMTSVVAITAVVISFVCYLIRGVQLVYTRDFSGSRST